MTFARCLLALAALTATASAVAHDGSDDPASHTHWWLGLGDVLARPDWYAGASFTQNTFDQLILDDGSFTSAQRDDRSNGVRLFGAVAWRYAAVEVGYADYGEATFSAQSDGSGSFWNAGPVAGSSDISGYDVSVIGRIPIGEAWAVVARAGLLMFDIDSTLSGDLQCCGAGSDASSASGNTFAYGVGAEYALGSWRIGAAYQATSVEDAIFIEYDRDLESLSASVAYVWSGSGRR